MTLSESLANLEKLQADYQQFHDDGWQDPESYGIVAESLRVAICTMRKYQQIQKIHNNWDVDFGVETHRAMNKIGEVIGDRTNDN